MKEHRIWYMGQHVIFYNFSNKFNRRFKKDPTAVPHQTVPLSRDITKLDNECRTREATKDEIMQAVIK